VSIGRTNMTTRSEMGTTPEHVLADHEFAVVFADSSGTRRKSGVGRVARARPFPCDALRAHHTFTIRGNLPFGFSRQSSAEPSRDGVRFIKGEMRDDVVVVRFAEAGE